MRRMLLALLAVGVFVAVALLWVFSLERAMIAAALRFVPRDAEVAVALSPANSGAQRLIIVGNDDRQNSSAEPAGSFGAVTGQRADVVMLAAIDHAHSEIRIMSIPRDLTVETEEFGPLVLGEAFGYGGSELLVSSVEDLTGLSIQHYVEFSLEGFAEIVDELNGVEVMFCQPSRDLSTGLSVPAGAAWLTGEEALSLVRSRQYERLVDGEWVNAGWTDRDRVSRQQELLALLVSRLRSDAGLRSLIGLGRAASSSVVADPGLDSDFATNALRLVRTGSVSTRAFPAVPIRPQIERDSPFGPSHLGGRLYLQPSIEIVEMLEWFTDGRPVPATATDESDSTDTTAPAPSTMKTDPDMAAGSCL